MAESQRKVVSEAEILSISCPKCHAIEEHGCLTNDRRVLCRKIDDTELAFHSERVFAAFQKQFHGKWGKLGATEKALICYYAYIMLCDSVSTKSVELLGKQFTTEQIQAFFANEAIQELKRDKLL